MTHSITGDSTKQRHRVIRALTPTVALLFAVAAGFIAGQHTQIFDLRLLDIARFMGAAAATLLLSSVLLWLIARAMSRRAREGVRELRESLSRASQPGSQEEVGAVFRRHLPKMITQAATWLSFRATFAAALLLIGELTLLATLAAQFAQTQKIDAQNDLIDSQNKLLSSEAKRQSTVEASQISLATLQAQLQVATSTHAAELERADSAYEEAVSILAQDDSSIQAQQYALSRLPQVVTQPVYTITGIDPGSFEVRTSLAYPNASRIHQRLAAYLRHDRGYRVSPERRLNYQRAKHLVNTETPFRDIAPELDQEFRLTDSILQLLHRFGPTGESGNGLWRWDGTGAPPELRPPAVEVAGHGWGFKRQSQIDLSYLDATDLRAVQLPLASLANAKFTDGADLTHSVLSGADLLNASLHKARLRWAQLDAALLSAADLEGADLRSADLSGARLLQTNLCGADLRGAMLDGATLLHANMIACRADGVDWTRSHLEHPRFEGSLMRDSLLNGLIHSGFAMFDVVDGERMSFLGARLEAGRPGESPSFVGAFLSEADFAGSVVERGDFRGAVLDGASFSGAALINPSFDGAHLYGADFGPTHVRLREVQLDSGAHVYFRSGDAEAPLYRLPGAVIVDGGVGAISASPLQAWQNLRWDDSRPRERFGAEIPARFGEPWLYPILVYRMSAAFYTKEVLYHDDVEGLSYALSQYPFGPTGRERAQETLDRALGAGREIDAAEKATMLVWGERRAKFAGAFIDATTVSALIEAAQLGHERATDERERALYSESIREFREDVITDPERIAARLEESIESWRLENE